MSDFTLCLKQASAWKSHVFPFLLYNPKAFCMFCLPCCTLSFLASFAFLSKPQPGLDTRRYFSLQYSLSICRRILGNIRSWRCISVYYCKCLTFSVNGGRNQQEWYGLFPVGSLQVSFSGLSSTLPSYGWIWSLWWLFLLHEVVS